jgi:IS30 family transposase
MRGGFGSGELVELWRRRGLGESTGEIAVGLGRSYPSVYGVLVRRGGIRPRRRVRAARCLGLAEREEISRGVCGGESFRGIARRLGCSASTVSREVARCGGRLGYRAVEADRLAWQRAERPKPCVLAANRRLKDAVVEGLEKDWSPTQISHWLVRAYPGDDTMRVSHETIYQSLFIQSRGVLKKELLAHLRRAGRIRRGRRPAGAPRIDTGIKDAVSIRQRPAEVEDRAVPGHWEGDLIEGKKNTYILTLVERQSRYVMLAKIENKQTQTVIDALIRTIHTLPTQLCQTLTWDRGKELSDHTRFTIATNVQVYFCDPASPWQRGTNENTNSLLRQYFPKNTDLSTHPQHHLNHIAQRLNHRPRQALNWENPTTTLTNALRVATTG